MKKTNRRPAALITGAARRIGRAVALELARDGFDIALHYRSSEKDALKTAADIRKQGVDVDLFPADLSAVPEAQGLILAALKRFPRLEVLINSASVFNQSGIASEDLEALEESWAIHLRAPWVLGSEFAHRIKRGVVINFLDTTVTVNRTAFGGYLVAKKALAGLTGMQAVRFAPGIRVNAVAPGFILPPPYPPKSFLKARARQVPLQRQGAPEEVAQAVSYLVKAKYVTGQTIFVDGGEHLI